MAASSGIHSWQQRAGRGLTPRSSGAPTACHQARSVAHNILHSPGLAPRRCRPLSSNVRRCVLHLHLLCLAPPQLRVARRSRAVGRNARPSGVSGNVVRVFAFNLGTAPFGGTLHRTHRLACPPPVHGNFHRSLQAVQASRWAAPNPSLKRSANSCPPGPFCGPLQSPQPGPGGHLLSPA